MPPSDHHASRQERLGRGWEQRSRAFLDERGRYEAPRVATRLAERGWVPEAIHSSDARRTRETAELLMEAFAPAPSLTFDPDLYLAGLPALCAAAQAWDPSWSTVLALGHNPGWQDAASSLCGSVLGMGTANAVLLEARPGAPAGWSRRSSGSGRWWTCYGRRISEHGTTSHRRGGPEGRRGGFPAGSARGLLRMRTPGLSCVATKRAVTVEPPPPPPEGRR